MTTNLKDEEIFLTAKEASKLTGYTKEYLNQLRFHKKGPNYYKTNGEGAFGRASGVIRYNKKELLDYIKNNTILKKSIDN